MNPCVSRCVCNLSVFRLLTATANFPSLSSPLCLWGPSVLLSISCSECYDREQSSRSLQLPRSRKCGVLSLRRHKNHTDMQRFFRNLSEIPILQASRGDMKQVQYWGPANSRRHRTKLVARATWHRVIISLCLGTRTVWLTTTSNMAPIISPKLIAT
jgi:hypothetical protein